MAATISSHISDYVLGQDESKAGDIAKSLFSKAITLVEVIEALGTYLLTPDVEQRRRGTQLLASVLQKLPSEFLTEKEVGHITAFLLSKLSDHHSIQPFALHGLSAVTGFSAFRDGDAVRQVSTDIFKEVQNQSLPQTDRRATYNIFLNLLTLHLTDVQALGDTFVCGYIQQMDGEKDPRNLMLAFRCSRLICHHFSLGPMEEDMFEVNSCYFPVDFVPPVNDPHGITRDDLSGALCAVMSSTPAFALYCYPLLIEKLSSEVASAKLDTVKTLCSCLPVYGTRHLQEYVGSLSTLLIREVRAASSDNLVAASLQALAAVASQLSQETDQLGEFMAETGSNLVCQVESENANARLVATRTLIAMATCNAKVCHAVALRLVPVVCTVAKGFPQLEAHTAFFTEVTSLLQHIADSQNTKAALDWSSLQEYVGALNTLCERLLASKDCQLQVVGLRGLSALSLWVALFSAEQVTGAVDAMMTKALAATDDEFRGAASKALSSVVTQQTHLAESVISKLNQVLQKNLAVYQTDTGRQTFNNGARLLSCVAVDSETGENVCAGLLSLLQAFQTGCEDVMVPVSDSLMAVFASGHLSPRYLLSSAVPSVLHFLWSSCAVWSLQREATHATVLSHLVSGLRSVTLLLDSLAAQEMVGIVCTTLLKGNSAGGRGDASSPLKATSPWQLSRLVQLLLAVSPCLEVTNDEVWGQLMAELPDLALQVKDDHSHQQACRCLAALVNKMPLGDWLDSTVKGLCARLTPCLTKESPADLDLRNKTLTLLTWLTKALVARGHKLSMELTHQLTSLLSDPTLGPKAAESFHVILAPSAGVLCGEVRANVTPMFQQRFLLQNLTPLLQGFQKAPLEVKENYLLAVAGMLPNVPQQVLVNELPQLLPVLISALSGSTPGLPIQALSTLTAGIRHTPDLLTPYLSDILPTCLLLATQGKNMRVRVGALQCVGEMVHLPPTVLQPHKVSVISKLKAVLDDRKRLVRKEAAIARSAWCLV